MSFPDNEIYKVSAFPFHVPKIRVKMQCEYRQNYCTYFLKDAIKSEVMSTGNQSQIL